MAWPGWHDPTSLATGVGERRVGGGGALGNSDRLDSDSPRVLVAEFPGQYKVRHVDVGT